MITIAILAVAFLLGIFAGVLALVRLGSSRDKHGRWFPRDAETRATAATRIITGLYVHMPGPVSQNEYAMAQLVPHRSRSALAIEEMPTHPLDGITPPDFEDNPQ